jgi:pyrroloquinoline quinone (PQQ) biosynthesis protein C
MNDFLAECERQVSDSWAAVKRGSFWRHVLEHGFDRELYVALMTEIYHYTRENSQNQALAALRVHSDRLSLLRFCLSHAHDEAGHDLMALHDLRSVGADVQQVTRSSPLPETQAFIGYLYRVASTRDATARLGYSYWAESSYPHIAEVLASMRSRLGLEDGDMTFFVAHSRIDEGHFEEVQRVMLENCTTARLRADLLDVLRTSLHLQGQMLEGVQRSYLTHRELVLEEG